MGIEIKLKTEGNDFNNDECLGSYVVEKNLNINLLYAQREGNGIVFSSSYSKERPTPVNEFERFISKHGFVLCK